MRIASVRIQNFRSFDDCFVELDRYTSLVGPNGAGKSTVLCALNIFFRETENSLTNVSDLDEQDFHNRKIDTPIVITVTFSDLNDVEKTTFREYFRHDKLVITASATWDADRRSATVKQFGQRLGMEDFRDFFKLAGDGAAAADLNVEYERLQGIYPDIPKATSKDAKRTALVEYEGSNVDKCVLIPSEDQFYGFSKGSNRLAQHVQWVYVPAVKDATKEGIEAKNTALGKILARTVRAKVKFDEEISKLREDTLADYRKILAAQQAGLDDISRSLTIRLGQWAHPNATARLEWTEELNKSVQVMEPIAKLFAGEGSFEGELVRFGHGLQRSYLLALLQELVTADDAGAPLLILGCEEPELYQHPPQARHLASVLQTLAEANAQVAVTTHSPYFVTGHYFEHVRMIRQDRAQKRSTVSRTSFDRIAGVLGTATGKKIDPPQAQAARLQQALQPHMNEMFFANKLVLVEGLEDIAYITTQLMLTGKWSELRRYGCQMIACNGKNHIPEALAIAQEFAIPAFVIFDGDSNVTNGKYRPMHEAENTALLKLLGGKHDEPFPNNPVWGGTYIQWATNLGDTLRGEVNTGLWDVAFGKATDALGKPEGKYGKNSIHIGHHLQELHTLGATPPSLVRMAEAVVTFAAS